MISNLLILKWWPFQYNTKFGKKAVFVNVLTNKAFAENFMRKLLFLIQISKVDVSICCTAELQVLELSATKMRVVSI